MVRNKSQKPLTEDPPEPDSSDEQPSGSSTEVDDASSSSSDDEHTQISTPAPPSKKPTTIEKQSSSSNSDSDDEPEQPVSKLKPTVTTKPRSKLTVAALAAEKRSAENTSDKESSKKARKDKPSAVTPVLNEDGSKKLFQRVFSEDDEIAILKGLIEFKERKGGADPMKNDVEFYNFIQKLLHVEVNRVQTVDKVRRLKKKFSNAKKSNKKIINEHEKKMFELSKKIWEENDNEDDKVKVKNDNVGGSKSVSKSLTIKSSIKGDNDDNGVVADKKAKKKEEEGGKGGAVKVVEEDDDGDHDDDNDDEMDDDFKVGEDEMKEGIREEALRKMGAKARAELREMWRKVENAQLEVDLMRNAARVEENKRVMEALGLVKH